MFIPMVTSKAILCEDLVQILPDIYYFWRGGDRFWKKKTKLNEASSDMADHS